MSDLTYVVLGNSEEVLGDLRAAFPNRRIVLTSCLNHLGTMVNDTNVRLIIDPAGVEPCCARELMRWNYQVVPSSHEARRTERRGSEGTTIGSARAAWAERTRVMAATRRSEKVRRFIDSALEHDHEWHTVQEVADSLQVSVRQMRRIVERELGYAPHVLLHLARVASVARDIAGSNEPLARIAAQHHFADLPTMSRQFKRFVGRTPGQYRRVAKIQEVKRYGRWWPERPFDDRRTSE